MFDVYLCLGSNIGNRIEFLSNAISGIKKNGEIQSSSFLFETEPVGIDGAEFFFNMALLLKTELLPLTLLENLQAIERSLGRKNDTHNLPREIDIDIALYNGYVYCDKRVEVPHPALETRRFMLEPLNEIAPDVLHPSLRKTIHRLLEECPDSHRVTKKDVQLQVH